jgi:hypothetical protein
MKELLEVGRTEAGAKRTARLEFGNFTRHLERTNDMNINAPLESMVRNLRYAIRSLAKTPAFAMTVILTLALHWGEQRGVLGRLRSAASALAIPGSSLDDLDRHFAQIRREKGNLDNVFANGGAR